MATYSFDLEYLALNFLLELEDVGESPTMYKEKDGSWSVVIGEDEHEQEV